MPPPRIDRNQVVFDAAYPTGLDLKGTVTGCPTELNSNLSSVDWTVDNTKVERIWLLNKLQSTPQFKQELHLLIVEYDDRNPELPSVIVYLVCLQVLQDLPDLQFFLGLLNLPP
jgi:hypothetical protein